MTQTIDPGSDRSDAFLLGDSVNPTFLSNKLGASCWED